MDLGINNKVALVTASGRGLGKAIALALSRDGAKTVICARNEDRLLKTRDEIAAETGGEVRAMAADMTDPKDIRALVEFTVREFGTVDILVCNAGGPPSGPADKFGPEDYQKALDLNLMSTIRLCLEAVPHMKQRKWGRIITLTSVSAKQPIDNLILSNTARAGVLGFSKSLSNQLAPFGITVNSVCPGYTKTERVEELAESFSRNGQGTTDDFYSRLEKAIPMGRLGRPEEIAAAAAFLASEPAAYITGVALQADGGYIKGIF